MSISETSRLVLFFCRDKRFTESIKLVCIWEGFSRTAQKAIGSWNSGVTTQGKAWKRKLDWGYWEC